MAAEIRALRRSRDSDDIRHGDSPSPKDLVANLGQMRLVRYYVHRLSEAQSLFIVSTVFKDRMRQLDVFNQVIQLKANGASGFNYTLVQAGVDFLFSDRVLSSAFATKIRDAARAGGAGEEPGTPISAKQADSPPQSPRIAPDEIRLSWGVVESQLSDLDDPEDGFNVDVLFDSDASQGAISKDIDLMNALRVRRFSYSLDEPRILFNFRTEGEAERFLAALRAEDAAAGE